ncbi:MAG TPA: DnaB-like helicase C-terminal domain-containing protein, partial [Candidatus Saccharimonadales bacterium]|nr:DnaB-like helicase C-terminal domain-containing protein [Candidatus Saccharimonadales bacterium]
ALDGIVPGLYVVVGRPGIGKTALVKQMLDQVALHNRVPGAFFSFAETRQELRIKTLARLSGLDSREIRRGSAYLLHWYGVPRLASNQTSELPPGWEKLRRAAEEAKIWLELIYLIECASASNLRHIEQTIGDIQIAANATLKIVVIDDGQRLRNREDSLGERLIKVTDELQEFAKRSAIAVFAVWPDLLEVPQSMPQIWAERVSGADVVMVLEKDWERTAKLNEPYQAITLHIVKNRCGERGKLAFDFQPACCQFVEA